MELGSEFNLDLHDLRISENSFFEYIGDMKYCLFDSGHNALRAILPALGSGYILMPECICASVLKCFSADKIIFYRLKDNLEIYVSDLLNKINSSTAAVYLMHYFGSLQPTDVLASLWAVKEKYGFIIIEDTTHSLFSKKRTIGDYCIASLRKWFALPNGGVLYSDNLSSSYSGYSGEIHRSIDNDKAYAMMLKTLFLNGRLDCNSAYRKIFAECEDKLNTGNEIRKISDYSEFLLRCNNVYDSSAKRKSNLSYLKDRLSNIGMRPICDFTENDCPFTLPVMVPDRDNFYKHLIDNKIYCAIHWPFDGLARNERPLALTLANSMISLPIDQRYGEEEMAYLLNVIGSYKGRLTF